MIDEAVKIDDKARLQLHLEPKEPVEVYELTAALGSLARQYNLFVENQTFFKKSGDGRLLVSSVQPGSIDISFVPDLKNAIALAAPVISDIKVVSEFAERLKWLVERFLPKKEEDKSGGGSAVTAQDCDDAVNILKPIAQHGGQQTFNVYNGTTIINPVIQIDAKQAREGIEEAVRQKARLLYPQAERRQRVSMVWKRLDKSPAQTSGSSPDKGLIEEIDSKPKTILFTDELSYLKQQMVADQDNPLQKVYFVDVEVSRVGERITAYRITGFHGTDDLEPTSPEDLGL